MTRILVTGAAGYTGSILCEHLIASGYEVVALDNLLYRQSTLFHLCASSNFEFVLGDVRDKQLMEGLLKEMDVIIPLAAIVGAPACSKDPDLATSINFDAISLLNQLRSPSQLVIYPNTNSGYGVGKADEFCTEETPLNPISIYGQTKVAAERVLLDSPNVIGLRLATVFGMSPRMRLDLLVNYFTYEAVTNGYIVIYEKDFQRNYIHVRDVADCYIHCIENANSMVGELYNLGLDDANLSKEQLALEVKKLVPDFYLHFADLDSDPDKRNYRVSNQKLGATGFTAKRSIPDGIQELLKGFRMMGRGDFTNV